MPDPQLVPPLSGWNTGYRSPRFFKDRYQLSAPFLSSQIGWAVQTENGQVINLGLTLADNDIESHFATTCSLIATGCRGGLNIDLQTLAAQQFSSADTSLWDTLYGLMRKAGPSLWPDVPGTQTNIATGKPVSIGKVDPLGLFQPTAPDGVVAGVGVPLIPNGIALGKRFAFASDPHVQLYLYADRDAVNRNASLLFSGGGVGLEGKTSSGNPVKLRLGAGRDQSGSGAGFITIQIGPDYLPQSPAP